MISYSTIYTDDFGKEQSTFESDGMSLKIQLRNHTFIGRSFELLELHKEVLTSASNFSFSEDNFLTDCSFCVKIPLRLKTNSNTLISILEIEVVLKNSTYPTTRKFALSIDQKLFDMLKGSEIKMWFETQMIQLQKLLPKNTMINSCIFCAYSNYWVGGSDCFGTLFCFKDVKERILAVKDKDQYMEVAEGNGIPTQETFWCSEFKEIEKNQWQYKDPT